MEVPFSVAVTLPVILDAPLIVVPSNMTDVLPPGTKANSGTPMFGLSEKS